MVDFGNDRGHQVFRLLVIRPMRVAASTVGLLTA